MSENVKRVSADFAHESSSINTVMIGDTVETIGDRAFYKCNNLSTLNIRDCSKLRLISADAFNETTKLKKVDFSSCLYHVKIGMRAFYKSGLEQVVFPVRLYIIEEDAFRFSKLTEVNLGYIDKMEKIGNNAFSNTKVKKISLPKLVHILHITAISTDNLEELTIGKVEKFTNTGLYNLSDADLERMVLKHLSCIHYKNVDGAERSAHLLIRYIKRYRTEYNRRLKKAGKKEFEFNDIQVEKLR